MLVSGLFSSCTTPAASCPTVASFSACTMRCSSSRISVRSRPMAITPSTSPSALSTEAVFISRRTWRAASAGHAHLDARGRLATQGGDQHRQEPRALFVVEQAREVAADQLVAPKAGQREQRAVDHADLALAPDHEDGRVGVLEQLGQVVAQVQRLAQQARVAQRCRELQRDGHDARVVVWRLRMPSGYSTAEHARSGRRPSPMATSKPSASS